MSDYNYLQASNGSGDVPLIHLTAARSIGATVFSVDTVTNVPTNFIGTCGTLLPSGFLDTTTKTDFKGHVSGSTLVIDSFEPGTTDVGNTSTQVIVIKPTTGWANRVANFLMNMTGKGTPEAVTVGSLTANSLLTANNGLTVNGPLTIPNKSLPPLVMQRPIKGRFTRGGDGVQPGGIWYLNNMDSVDYNFGFTMANGGIKVPYDGVYDVQGVNSFMDVAHMPASVLTAFNVNNPTTPGGGGWVRTAWNSNPSSVLHRRSYLLSANDIVYQFHYADDVNNYRIRGGGDGGNDCSWMEIEYKGPRT